MNGRLARLAGLAGIGLLTSAGLVWAQAGKAGKEPAKAEAALKEARPAPAKTAEPKMDFELGKLETGTKEEVEELLRGEVGEGKTGDLKQFTVATDNDITTLEQGDLYKNEDTLYKVVAIRKKGPKGGQFVMQRIAGQSQPQRRWVRLSGTGPANIASRVTLLDLYIQGGPFLHPIAVLFVTMIILTINGILLYRRGVHVPEDFVKSAETALRKGDARGFEELSATHKGLMAFVCRAMVDHTGTATVDEIRFRVEAAARAQISRLRIPIRALNLIAVAAPLLGLLGTIVGMVIVFEGVAGSSGAAKASILAAGIRVKLFSTASALMVAIPSLFIYFIMSQKFSTIVGETEMITEHFLHILTRGKRGAGAPARARGGAPDEQGEC